MTTTSPATAPSPAAATDEAAFIAQLRRLRTWSGLSFRQLERRASAAGDSLPASTAATMLGKNRLPREELLVTFVRACGLEADDVRRWVAARVAIADGTAIPPARSRSGWRPALVAAAVVAAFACGAVFTATAGSSTDVHDVEIATR